MDFGFALYQKQIGSDLIVFAGKTRGKTMSDIKREDYRKETWLDRLNMLCVKFSHLGANDDIAAMSEEERCGLYWRLQKELTRGE